MELPAVRHETPDFAALLTGLDQELALSIAGDYWITLVGIRVFDTLAPGSTEPGLLERVQARLPELIVETIRNEATAVRPRDVYAPLGDVFFVIFPGTPEPNVFAPLRRILDAWRTELDAAGTLLDGAVERTLHIGIVSWGPPVRPTSGRELLGFGTFMVDEAGRQPIDTSIYDLLGVSGAGAERVHVARFRWL